MSSLIFLTKCFLQVKAALVLTSRQFLWWGILDKRLFIYLLNFFFNRCSSWMQAPQQQSHSCHFPNWKIYELEEAAEAVRHLRIITDAQVVRSIWQHSVL